MVNYLAHRQKQRNSYVLYLMLVIVISCTLFLSARIGHANVAVEESAVSAWVSFHDARFDLVKHYLHTGGEQNRLAAIELLRAVASEGEPDAVLTAYLVLGKIRNKYIRARYPQISDEAYEKYHGSAGAALLFTNSSVGADEVIDVLIEEAWCLSAPAHIALEVLYRIDFEGYPKYDERILEFFMKSASEGSPPSKQFLAKILINGWGITKNKELGQQLLKLSDR